MTRVQSNSARVILISGLAVSLGCVLGTVLLTLSDAGSAFRPGARQALATNPADPMPAGEAQNFMQLLPTPVPVPGANKKLASSTSAESGSSSGSSSSIAKESPIIMSVSPSNQPSKTGHWDAFIKAEERVLNHLASTKKPGEPVRVGDIAFSGPFLDENCSAAIEEMGRQLKVNPCTEQEQLESAFLFGEAAENGAGSTAFHKFCESSCIKRVVQIGRQTVLKACKILDQSSHFERLLLVCPPHATPTPSVSPTRVPTGTPTEPPSAAPSDVPTFTPSPAPSAAPSWGAPTIVPSYQPTLTLRPSDTPSALPTVTPTEQPSLIPTSSPSLLPSSASTMAPSTEPSISPSQPPSLPPTSTSSPTAAPTHFPTMPLPESCEMEIKGDSKYWNATNFDKDIGLLLHVPPNLVAIEQVRKENEDVRVIFTVTGGTSLRSCCKELRELLQAKDERILTMNVNWVKRYSGIIPTAGLPAGK